jgi:uncharacterized membrane protein
MNKIISVILVLLTLAYPFAIYFGLSYFEPRYFALFLLIVFAMRFALSYKAEKQNTGLLICVTVFLIFAFYQNSTVSLFFYPVIVSGFLLCVFSYSLFTEQTVIERLARLSEPNLPPEGVLYTRTVTKVWCGFFTINGLIALATVYIGDVKIWSLYNGFISYLIMGSIFAIEFIVRQKVKAQRQ